ncbi:MULTISPECIES: hypothetical protein [Marinobacter]|jgi:hypothetical protein|uniref:DUF5666 domain-containing protein n=1 Tax=Marinobacter salarius TaxID=1420917 RepID=A0A1W6KDD6_9GAMM|nr:MULTISPECIES: hypothetical protein [Marinobacter]ARM85417.1 hypothetical protein MARSALSMR5_03383 [Marinobacter salarius]AZR40283.1 hypothetical protein MTMN5_00820 [Marinobacter salarius]MBJ7302537.1 hypothetical protein [Marinobacter salarius]MCC4285806.1 hypothetical protein [Marinobacter salarius]MCZ4286625.1 hypothetical protein [Marinobacter salarius]
MITRLLLNQPRRALAVALIALAATMTSGMAFAQADDEVMEGNPISLENVVFEGTVNFVHPDSFMLVIDDYSFVLERVITFNGGTWSREQVVQRLAQGDRLKLELGGIADQRSGARLVQKIEVLN